MNLVRKIVTLLILLFGEKTFAQALQTKPQKDNSYEKVITERAAKIVKTLEISDSLKFQEVRDIVVAQYKSLNTFYEDRSTELKEIANRRDVNKMIQDSLSKIVMTKSEGVLTEIHLSYLKNLSRELSKKQIEKVKDGMTYNVFPNTYRAYQDMMPDLTKKQKKQLFDYLYEAREHAMDAESSEKKHAWFGKYKGRINNYLSKEGIDMKQASTAWEKRIREAEEAKKNLIKNP